MSLKKALISGVSGQSGSYLAELLLEKGYEVHGIVRRTSTSDYTRISSILDKIILHQGDITDQSSINSIFTDVMPDEVYNLAAQSFVAASWNQPVLTADITAVGVTRMLEAVRQVCPFARFYQASSSEMFGLVQETPQTEKTPFYPRSPYGVAKLYGHWITINYRESYNLYAVSGICYNHESPRRGKEFVTKKIAAAVAKIYNDIMNNKTPEKLRLGNLDAKRDWGSAKDYVEGMWLSLQKDYPDDYIFATGETHSVREFVDLAFKVVGLDYEDHICIDKAFMRPAEVDLLLGDPSKAVNNLGWKHKTTFNELVKWMVIEEIESFKKSNH